MRHHVCAVAGRADVWCVQLAETAAETAADPGDWKTGPASSRLHRFAAHGPAWLPPRGQTVR